MEWEEFHPNLIQLKLALRLVSDEIKVFALVSFCKNMYVGWIRILAKLLLRCAGVQLSTHKKLSRPPIIIPGSVSVHSGLLPSASTQQLHYWLRKYNLYCVAPQRAESFRSQSVPKRRRVCTLQEHFAHLQRKGRNQPCLWSFTVPRCLHLSGKEQKFV